MTASGPRRIVPAALDGVLERWVLRADPLKMLPAIEAPSTTSADVLDQTVLADLRSLRAQGGKDIFTQLIDLFTSLTPPKLATLRAALTSGDSRIVTQQAHSLRGSSASIGAQHM